MASEKTASKVSRTMTNNELATVQGALAALFAIVGSADFSEEQKALPVQAEWETMSPKVAEAVLVRVAAAYAAKQEEGTREIMIAVKKGVDAACHQARLATIEGFREIAKLSPATRAMLGSKGVCPESTTVALAEVSDLFPEGTTEETMVALLHRGGFKLAQGKSKEGKRLFVQIGKDVAERMLAEVPAAAAE